MPDEPASRTSRRRSGINPGKAAAVIVGFLVATLLLISPASHALRHTNSTPTTTRPTTAPRPVNPARTTVQVANATKTQNLASHYTNLLLTLGWDALTPLQASYLAPRTTIYYRPGYVAAAQHVADDINLPSALILPFTQRSQVSGSGGDDIVVVLGPDAAS